MALITPNTGSLILGSDQRVTGLAGALAMTGLAASLLLGTVLTPTTGSASLTGLAPTVSQSTTNTSITPTVGSLVCTGTVPAQAITTTPTAVALAFTGLAPTVSQGSAPVSLTPTVGALTLTGAAPTVAQVGSTTRTPDTGALVLGLGNDIVPMTGTLTLSGAPSVGSPQVQPASGTLTISPNQPAFSTRITPGVATLKIMQWAQISWLANTEIDLAGYIVYRGSTSGVHTESRNVNNVLTYVWNDLPYGPNYFAVAAYDTSSNVSAKGTEVSVITSGGGWQPVVQRGIPVPVASLALTGAQPSVVQTTSGSTSISPFSGSLALTTATPATAPVPVAATLSLTGAAPVLATNTNQAVTPTVGTLTITGTAPAPNMAVVPSVGALALTTFAPTAESPITVRPTTGALTVTGVAASIPGIQVTPGTGALSIRGSYETPYPCAGNWGTFTWGGLNWCSDRKPHAYEVAAVEYLVHHLSVEVLQTGSTDWVLDRITPIVNVNAHAPDTYQAAVDRHNMERMSVEVLCTSRDDFALYTLRPVMNLRKKWRDT